MNIYKKLLKNSGIFALANLGSKMISILLVPFYTYVLSTGEYGQIDLIMTTISLLLPVITLSIFEATLRFALKSDYNKNNIFSSSIIVLLVGNALLLLFYPIISRIIFIKDYIFLFYLVLLAQGFNLVFSQFARGINKVKIFAINGVINTFIILVFNIILLAKFNMGIRGYFISILIANIICNIYIIFSIKLWRYFKVESCNYELVKEMLIYSMPLIPNALMWWMMNVSDRYVITLILGVSANGIYAVANKIPTILMIINSIFSQSWQLSAIEEGDSKNKSEFYTNIFNIFSLIMLVSSSCILVVVKPIVTALVSVEFSESWKFIPFLLLAVVFSSFSTFLGTNYIAMKKTKGALKTSAIGASINIILNFILIPIIGLNGAAIATMMSFFIVWILRIYDTREFVIIKLNISTLVFTIVIIFIQIAILFMGIKFNIFIQVILVITILLINKKMLQEGFKMIIKLFNKNK